MNQVLLANILTIIGETALFVASTRKNKKDILIFQDVFFSWILTDFLRFFDSIAGKTVFMLS